MTKVAAFYQKDVERACKGVRDAGYPLRKVVITDGKIELTIGECNEVDDPLAAEIERDRQELERQIHGKK